MAGNVFAKSMATRLIISRPGVPVEERVFEDEIITIGSDPAATLRLEDPSVASEQAIIIREEGLSLLINRAPGTMLNGEPLAREARRTLSEGDRIEVGPYAVNVAPSDADAYARGHAESQTGADYAARSDYADAAAPREDEEGGVAAGQSRPQQQARSFAAILDSLRTEEDSFYFVVESAGGRRRVRIDSAETMVGWDETGLRVSCDAGRVVAARAVVRKDWSGVVALPLRPGMLLVNGETVEAPRRLRDGDRLTLMHAGGAEPEDACLVFHEPASLVVLDTLLPQQQLPPPVARAGAAPVSVEAVSPATRTRDDEAAAAGLLSPERRYFGYFTPVEMLVMVVGTLVAAAIIFMILEYA
jgi:sulfur carrier protein ThiS